MVLAYVDYEEQSRGFHTPALERGFSTFVKIVLEWASALLARNHPRIARQMEVLLCKTANIHFVMSPFQRSNSRSLSVHLA